MIVVTYLMFVVVLLLSVYVVYAKSLLPASWREANATELANGELEWSSEIVGKPGFVNLFSGPEASKKQRIHEDLVHLPMQLYRVAKLFLFTLPAFKASTLLDTVKRKEKQWDPRITDASLFDLLTHSVLLLVAGVSEDGKLLQLAIPEDLPLETKAGLRPAGLNVSFSIADKKIVGSSWNGQDIAQDTDLIACFFVMAIIGWGHPQSHILSEKSAREIARKGITTLEPSSRYVLALHEGLLYSPISPIDDKDHFFNSNVTRQSMIDSAFTPIPHDLDRRKIDFEYFNFLFRARMVLMKLLAKHRLEVNAEWLFNNMIVHSVDHYCAYKYIGKFKSWTMDGSKTSRSYVRAKMFWAIWLPDYESQVEQQRIGKMSAKKYPFYRELYLELKPIHREFADCILASTSF